MFESSMKLTIGTALDRAADEHLEVRLHVGGEWIVGQVVNNDGHGVAVLESSGDMCVLRPDAISCVRIPQGGQQAQARPAGAGSHASHASESAGPGSRLATTPIAV